MATKENKTRDTITPTKWAQRANEGDWEELIKDRIYLDKEVFMTKYGFSASGVAPHVVDYLLKERKSRLPEAEQSTNHILTYSMPTSSFKKNTFPLTEDTYEAFKAKATDLHRTYGYEVRYCMDSIVRAGIEYYS
ncbi:hypothetical protein SAMN05421493_1189 [Pseudobutyrivibrio sp. 49]|uniref:hypothetical protein n=1 Tax=Pseudobutyrivibrio sp. 49 TaxID=1855344 RepID=UPI00088302B2|nr:hypothetical protein [Pseudobutyrivibrio sp. 49]SDI55858.1 hypothetical protein SAMN05421493_1189 [Pseudobutyrivibrio sp. 49]